LAQPSNPLKEASAIVRKPTIPISDTRVSDTRQLPAQLSSPRDHSDQPESSSYKNHCDYAHLASHRRSSADEESALARLARLAAPREDELRYKALAVATHAESVDVALAGEIAPTIRVALEAARGRLREAAVALNLAANELEDRRRAGEGSR
jgi:hypothetical protein